MSGPWSVEWLQDHNKGCVGLTSTKRKKLNKVVKEGDVNNFVKTKKAGGLLRH